MQGKSISSEHDRRSIRLSYYDYSFPGAYFITICTSSRRHILGLISNGEMRLTPIGRAAEQCLLDIPEHCAKMSVPVYVIMPNHVHAVICITDPDFKIFQPVHDTFKRVRTDSISTAVRAYKAAVTGWCRKNGYTDNPWQRNFYERIVRSEPEYRRIEQYILSNPANWELDRENKAAKNYSLKHDEYFRDLYDGLGEI